MVVVFWVDLSEYEKFDVMWRLILFFEDFDEILYFWFVECEIEFFVVVMKDIDGFGVRGKDVDDFERVMLVFLEYLLEIGDWRVESFCYLVVDDIFERDSIIFVCFKVGDGDGVVMFDVFDMVF